MVNQDWVFLLLSFRREKVSFIEIGDVILSWEQETNLRCVQGV